eukprot:1147574-Pelagomonas_calceolata.AAC.3
MSLDRSLNFNSAVEEAPMSSGNYSISYFCLPTSAYTPPKCFFNHTSSLQARTLARFGALLTFDRYMS